MDLLVSHYAKKIELEGKSSRASKVELESLETKILETSTTTYNSMRENDPEELKGATLEQFRLGVEAGVKADIVKKNAAIEKAAEEKKVKAKAARDAKKAEKLGAGKGPEVQQSKAGPEETEDQQSNAGPEETEDQQSNAGPEETEYQQSNAGTEEAEDQQSNAGPEETEDQQSNAGPEETEDQQSNAGPEETEDQQSNAGPEETEDQQSNAGPEETEDQQSNAGTEEAGDPNPSVENKDIEELVRKLRSGLRLGNTLAVHVNKDTGSQLRDTQAIVCSKRGVGNHVIVVDAEYSNAPIYRIRHDIEPGGSPNLMGWRREHTLNPKTEKKWTVDDVAKIIAIALDVPPNYDKPPEERARLVLSREEKRKLKEEKKKVPKQPDVQVLIEWKLPLMVFVEEYPSTTYELRYTSWESRSGCRKIWKSNADNRINEWAQQFETWYRTVGGRNSIERSMSPVEIGSVGHSTRNSTEEAEDIKAAAEKTAAEKTAAEKTAAEKTAAEKAAAEKAAAEKTAAEKTAAEKDAAEKALKDANYKQELKKKKIEQEILYRETLDIPEDRPLTMDEKMGLAQIILKITA
ncbi:hypothetical protein V490_00461 [Pseudogymnoascus sp. VKM F-3557]|nr:hypothetical protein V490_00461 [Pseudogymnoascus sp. VKM F-3557]